LNSEDLSEKIEEMISNETLRSNMAKSARSYAVARYSLEKTSDKLKRIFL